MSEELWSHFTEQQRHFWLRKTQRKSSKTICINSSPLPVVSTIKNMEGISNSKEEDSLGKRKDARLPTPRWFLRLWITPESISLSPLTTQGTPSRSLLTETPNFGTHSCACVWAGAATGPAATCWTNYTHEAMDSNQKDIEISLWCQNPAEHSQETFRWWAGTVRQPTQRVHSSTTNSRCTERVLVWVAYLQLLLKNLLLLCKYCLPAAL